MHHRTDSTRERSHGSSLCLRKATMIASSLMPSTVEWASFSRQIPDRCASLPFRNGGLVDSVRAKDDDPLCRSHGTDWQWYPVRQHGAPQYAFHHIFNRVCDEHGIEHRLTQGRQPWADGRPRG